MIRKTFPIILLVCLAAFLASPVVKAQDPEDVHVTQHGAKYHKEICRLIKTKETTVLEKEEALGKGYLPCRRCYKEDIDVDPAQTPDN